MHCKKKFKKIQKDTLIKTKQTNKIILLHPQDVDTPWFLPDFRINNILS